MAEYILTGSARRHLNGIRDYLATAPEHIRARELDNLLACFVQAAEFPFSGRSEPQVKISAREPRSLLSYPYRVYYYPEPSPVQIFMIRHGKRQPPVGRNDL